jgi:hypothetical protein
MGEASFESRDDLAAPLPAVTRPDWISWSSQGVWQNRQLPFVQRTNTFVWDLLDALEMFPTFVVQPLRPNEFPSVQGIGRPDGLHFHIVRTSTQKGRGKKLFVVISQHDSYSGPNFGFGLNERKNYSYYRAWDSDALHWDKKMHWKNCGDALNGITQWVLSSIHIPGPE